MDHFSVRATLLCPVQVHNVGVPSISVNAWTASQILSTPSNTVDLGFIEVSASSMVTAMLNMKEKDTSSVKTRATQTEVVA